MHTSQLDANNAAADDEYLLRRHQPLMFVLRARKPALASDASPAVTHSSGLQFANGLKTERALELYSQSC